MPATTPLVLGSESPRRLQLLRQVGIEPIAQVGATLDETALAQESPEQLSLRLARAKAALVAQDWPDAFVLAADTVVAVGRRALGKATNAEEAARFLRLLSGRRHQVITSVAVIAPGGRSGHKRVLTRVAFKRLHPAEIAHYVAGEEWRGKAGGYAVQGTAAAFVVSISGSYSGVVGLPLYETVALLQGLGFRPDASPASPA